MMPRRATDGVIDSGMTHRDQEFREHEAVCRLSEMLAKAPPTEIIRLLHSRVGTFEKRNVGAQPCPRFGVGDKVCPVLILHGVEAIDIVSERCGLQNM